MCPGSTSTIVEDGDRVHVARLQHIDSSQGYDLLSESAITVVDTASMFPNRRLEESKKAVLAWAADYVRLNQCN